MRKRLRVKHLYAFFASLLLFLHPFSCSNPAACALAGAMRLRNYMNVWEGEARAASWAAFG